MRPTQYINEESKSNDILVLNHRKFHEHLIDIHEVFDKDIKLEKPIWDGVYFSINFNIDGELYTFKAKENAKGEFSILFWASGLLDVKGSDRYSGDIFSAVKKSLHLLMKKRNVNMFYFNSDEIKLIKLYDRILKRMMKEFKDFEFDGNLMKGKVKFWIYKRKL
jgi:hypothetical protein